jgi:hypothetical protein
MVIQVGLSGTGAGDEVLAGSDAELVVDVPEVEPDGLDADVELGPSDPCPSAKRAIASTPRARCRVAAGAAPTATARSPHSIASRTPLATRHNNANMLRRQRRRTRPGLGRGYARPPAGWLNPIPAAAPPGCSALIDVSASQGHIVRNHLRPGWSAVRVKPRLRRTHPRPRPDPADHGPQMSRDRATATETRESG